MSNPNVLESSPIEEKTYRVGTLTYTFRGLVVVFTWMLFGDFCFSMMESVIPSLLPLTLKNLDASNRTISLLVSTIPLILNMVITPVLGFRSDRHRGRRGRRIPYLLWPTPFITLSLIAVGYGADIGAAIHRWFFAAAGGGSASAAQVTLITVGVLSVIFQFFNLFVTSVFYWLFNDVIPEPLMGRFYALFRVVGNAAGFIFNRWIFGLSETHSREIYVAMGLIYFVSFTLMCLNVKEGTYPPPEVPKNAGFWTGLRTFVRECYSMPYYWSFHLAYTLMVVANVTVITFRVFLGVELGLSRDDIGKINSWGLAAGFLLAYPFGWLADKIHSTRLYLIAVGINLIVSLASIWAIQSPQSFWLLTMLWFIGNVCFAAANAPLFPHLLPKEQYGQFASATALFAAGTAALASYLGGAFIDWAGNYRAIYVWSAAFSLLALVFSVLLYRGFLRYGGDKNYVAPVVSPFGPGLEPVPVRKDRMSKEHERESENP